MARHSESSDKSNEVDSTTDKLQRRRYMKHMVEKRRRNRINDCLENMRKLVLKAQNKNPENYTKMEKADILEMTTNFLSLLNQQKEAANQVTPGVSQYDMPRTIRQPMPANEARDYTHGYNTCQTEINNYLNNYRMRNQSRASSPTYGFQEEYKNTQSPYGFQYAASTSELNNNGYIADMKSTNKSKELTAKRTLDMGFKPINNNNICTVSSSESNVWRPW